MGVLCLAKTERDGKHDLLSKKTLPRLCLFPQPEDTYVVVNIRRIEEASLPYPPLRIERESVYQKGICSAQLLRSRTWANSTENLEVLCSAHSYISPPFKKRLETMVSQRFFAWWEKDPSSPPTGLVTFRPSVRPFFALFDCPDPKKKSMSSDIGTTSLFANRFSRLSLFWKTEKKKENGDGGQKGLAPFAWGQ